MTENSLRRLELHRPYQAKLAEYTAFYQKMYPDANAATYKDDVKGDLS